MCGQNNSTITNCYNEGTVSGGDNSSWIGGVCGYNNSGTITNCYNTAAVSGSEDVGGVCGYNEGTITNCYNEGTVSGGRYYVGGVCGDNIDTITNCYYLADSETDSIDGTTFKTTDQFAGGEVAYILQSAQTAATEGDPVPQVWGQKLTGETKDTSPVLTSNSAKKVYKVTFATQSNSFYAVKYANPSGVYELPTAPSIDNSNNGFYKWSTSKTDYSNAANDFTKNTAVAGDMTVYAVSGEKYGENDNEKTVTTTYGTGTTQDLSAYTVFASYTPAEGETPASGTASAGKFTYTIESGNDVLGATVDGDTLTIPSTAAAGTYNLTIKATVKTDNVSLMSVEFGTVPLTFDVTVKVKFPSEPIGKYADKITIDNDVADGKAVFTITPLDSSTDEIPSVTLYLAEYNDNGQLSSVKKGVKNTDGKLEITLPTTNNYKLMLWDNDQCPLINAITNIY